MFSVLNRPFGDSLRYISNKYGIYLEPTDRVEKLFINSKNYTGSIEGPTGYTNVRGRHENSYENQLAKLVKSKIIFNSAYEYEHLCKEFEYVVLATGDGEYASHLGNYRSDLTCTIRGATIEGSFDTRICHVWFNYEIIPKGYVFFNPIL